MSIYYLTIYEWLMLLSIFPGIPIVGITMAVRSEKKFIASYPPEHRELAKQASDEMWPTGVLNNIIALKEDRS